MIRKDFLGHHAVQASLLLVHCWLWRFLQPMLWIRFLEYSKALRCTFWGKEKTHAAQSSRNFCYLIGWKQDDQKIVLLKVLLHKFVQLKYFWTQFKNVHLQGPCSLRPCISRPYCIRFWGKYFIKKWVTDCSWMKNLIPLLLKIMTSEIKKVLENIRSLLIKGPKNCIQGQCQNQSHYIHISIFIRSIQNWMWFFSLLRIYI